LGFSHLARKASFLQPAIEFLMIRLGRGAPDRGLDRILKGEKPADLPAQLRPSTRWCSTSRPRRPKLAIPPTLLARAEEVIE
jgi:hypothetical protein